MEEGQNQVSHSGSDTHADRWSAPVQCMNNRVGLPGSRGLTQAFEAEGTAHRTAQPEGTNAATEKPKAVQCGWSSTCERKALRNEARGEGAHKHLRRGT